MTDTGIWNEYNLIFSSLKLTITMTEVDSGTSKQNLIDKFTVMLSLSGASNVDLIGDEGIATIKLVHWINISGADLEHSPTSQPSAEC